MSLHQSRPDKSEAQLKKAGRFGSSGHQRGFSGGGGRGGGGGSAPPPLSSTPSSSSSSNHLSHPPPLLPNRSVKKSGNGQGGHSRVNPGGASSDVGIPATSASTLGVQDRGHARTSSHGASFVLAPGTAKPTDSSASSNIRGLSKPPPSQSSARDSDSATPATPAKGDTSKTFTLQFGSISPGFVNGMQIPVRTSSAPPNLDEQKRDQAIPTAPIQSAPKLLHQQPKKDLVANHSTVGDSHPPPLAKRDISVPAPVAPIVPLQKSSVVPKTGMPMPMGFQQQIPIQFGGPSPQLHTQGVTGSSLQIPVSLSVGSAQVQQQMFVPNIPSHTFPQGLPQGLGFAQQMAPQLASQMGNLRMGLSQQYVQQQDGKFTSVRRTVKITDPHTHEELKLDKRTDSCSDAVSSGQRLQHSNVPPQAQAVSSYTPGHQMNYCQPLQPGPYNPCTLFFQTPTSHPLTSTQVASGTQGTRYNYQIGQSGSNVSFLNPPVLNHIPVSIARPQSHGISEQLNLDRLHDSLAAPVSLSSTPVQVTVKPPTASTAEKVVVPLVNVTKPTNKDETPNLPKPPEEDTASHQQIGRNESTSEISVQLSQTYSGQSSDNLLPAKGIQSSSMSSVGTAQRMQPNIPSSAAATAPVLDSTSVVSVVDGRKKDLFKRSDSLKDQQKIPSKKDIQQLQQQHQVDAPDSATGTKLEPIKVSKENPQLELNVTGADKNSEDVHVNAGPVEPSTSTPTLASPRVEYGNSTEDVVFATDDIKAIPASMKSSVAILENQVLGDTLPSISSASEAAVDNVPPADGAPLETSTSCDVDVDETVSKNFGAVQNDCSPLEFESKQETVGAKESVEDSSNAEEHPDSSNAKEHPDSSALESAASGDQIACVAVEEEGAGDGNMEKAVSLTEDERIQMASETTGQSSEINKEVEDLTKDLNKLGVDDLSHSHIDDAVSIDDLKDKSVIKCIQGATLKNTNVAPSVTDSSLAVSSLEITQKPEKVSEISRGSSGSASFSGTKERASSESIRAKNTAAKKKKRKEVLLRADAAGTNSDLYMAYKGPEEKQEVVTSECVENYSAIDMKQVAVHDKMDSIPPDVDEQSKVELDDWEDAIDISAPNLRASENGQPGHGNKRLHDEFGNAAENRKYSRDFLLTLKELCTDLPVGFEIGSDIADALMSIPVSTPHVFDREPFLSPGRIIDRPIPTVAIRDRRPVSNVDDDKWTKMSGPFGPGRDLRVDITSFRHGQGVGHGVLRNPRGQSSPYTGGILSGPMQAMPSPGGISRGNADADRWQRGSGIQRGLIPSPQTPLQVMHKAEERYEVGKESDEEETKQRKLKGILNKLTPQNFDRLFDKVKEVNIDNAATLRGVISQIFDKALMEPTFCEMYANFCFHLAGALPDFSEDNEKITFKRLLLNKCQEEFERGEREQDEANRDEEGEIKKSAEEREEKKIQARRRMLGNIRLIGELYKKKMLTERIMHECIKKLLGQYPNPDEEDIEALCKLMSTIGEMIDHSKAKEHMDAYFDMMMKLSSNQKLSSRVRFMLKDAIDLRKNKWQQRRKVEGPKKIEEVHRDAAQERQAQASRLARGPSISSSGRRGMPAVDYGSRGSSTLLPSLSSQSVGASRSFPSQSRGFGAQDVRMEDRHPFESKTHSVPLPQRPIVDDSITLGPQGGLAKGMSNRGQPLMPTIPLGDVPSSTVESRRLASGSNGYSSLSDRTPHNSREELMPRYMHDRHSGGPHDQSITSSQDRNPYVGGRDLRNSEGAFDRSSAITPTGGRGLVSSTGSHNAVSEARPLSEECLREKSISAIREFYSAKDENEVVLCVRELNSPSFYPAMVSLWVTDSFERKDMDRDSLAKLLIHLSKPRDSLLSHVQLCRGFESVLYSLEDAVNDAPKAAEFLGRMFAKVVLEDALSLREIGRLIQEGGEEPGHLINIGLAAEVLGSTLEFIRTEKGDTVLNDIRLSSNLKLEDFRPSYPVKPKKLDAFI
uniref:Eukaryotic translation initiation factor 4G n=1 Tax=Anthurium amnicola TaxID=1678845 RepID=A0A1D1YZ85_9ARAE